MAPGAKILFIGDIVGRPGRNAVKALLPGLLKKYAPDAVVANGENAAGGFGITPEICVELRAMKIDVLTSGNHIWDKKEIYPFINGSGNDYLLRPANYPEGAPGPSHTVFKSQSGAVVAVLNLAGRVFMDNLDCPFRAGKRIVKELREKTPVILVDMHAETTSEKAAMAWHLDGLVTAVIGTHTHVQTSDERILPGGTAFLTDAGMTGPTESIIGMERETVLDTFLTRMPSRFEVASRGVELQGAFVEAAADGKAASIERIRMTLEEGAAR